VAAGEGPGFDMCAGSYPVRVGVARAVVGTRVDGSTLRVDLASAAGLRHAEGVSAMTEGAIVECRTCKQPLMDTEWGLMCRRAVRGWTWENGQWKRPFARHPESNAFELEYLKKYGQPTAVVGR